MKILNQVRIVLFGTIIQDIGLKHTQKKDNPSSQFLLGIQTSNLFYDKSDLNFMRREPQINIRNIYSIILLRFSQNCRKFIFIS